MTDGYGEFPVVGDRRLRDLLNGWAGDRGATLIISVTEGRFETVLDIRQVVARCSIRVSTNIFNF